MREFGELVLGANSEAACAFLDLLADLSASQKGDDMIARYASSGSCKEKTDAKRNRLQLRYFSEHDFLMLMLKYKEEHNLTCILNFTILSLVLDRLEKFGLVNKREIPELNEYKISQTSIPFFNSSRLAHNIVFGVAHMIRTISPAVPAINVINANGDIECGSGIIIRRDMSEVASLITNAHVLKDRKIHEIISDGMLVEVISGPDFHDSADLAHIRVKATPSMPLIPVDDEAPVLTPIVALGYPRIPLAAEQLLLAHRGEINGTLRTLSGEEFLAISCHVSPGNSGGPIVTESGFCAGIVTQSGIGQFGSEDEPTGAHRTVYHMAIPPKAVSNFLAQFP